MSITKNYYEGDVEVFDLKAGDKVMLYRSQNVYKIKDTKLEYGKVGCADVIYLTFEDGEIAGYCSDGEVSCANKLKYYHNISRTIRGGSDEI